MLLSVWVVLDLEPHQWRCAAPGLAHPHWWLLVATGVIPEEIGRGTPRG